MCGKREPLPNILLVFGARLLEGRYFTAAEDATKPPVTLINRPLARQCFPGEHPVGMLINYDGGKPDQAMQIIGLIDDICEGPLDTEARAAFYVPFDQHPLALFSVDRGRRSTRSLSSPRSPRRCIRSIPASPPAARPPWTSAFMTRRPPTRTALRHGWWEARG
jgi:hypothetical protein